MSTFNVLTQEWYYHSSQTKKNTSANTLCLCPKSVSTSPSAAVPHHDERFNPIVCLLSVCRYHHCPDDDNAQYQCPPLPAQSFLCHGHGLVHRRLLCLRLFRLDWVCGCQLLFHAAGQPGAAEGSGHESSGSRGSGCGCSCSSGCSYGKWWRGLLSESDTLFLALTNHFTTQSQKVFSITCRHTFSYISRLQAMGLWVLCTDADLPQCTSVL